MCKIILFCSMVLVQFINITEGQSMPDMSIIENLVNSTVNEMFNDIKYYKIQSDWLLKSFNEKLHVVQYVINMTQLKMHDTEDKLNRMVIGSNQGRKCALAYRHKIQPYSDLKLKIENCIKTAEESGIHLLTKINKHILNAESFVNSIESEANVCKTKNANNPELIMNCIEELIDEINALIQNDLNLIAIEMERSTSDALFFAIKAQHCVYEVIITKTNYIEKVFGAIKNCLKLYNNIERYN